MTNMAHPDEIEKSSLKNCMPLFASSEFEMKGVRVTRADFSRIMGVSKQAVTDWVKSGRIVVGPDGRFDPSKAVASMVRTGDPSKIRAGALAPLVAELSKREQRISQLESSLAMAVEDREFYEGAVIELNAVLDSLRFNLELSWPALLKQKEGEGLQAISAWLDKALMIGGDPGVLIVDGFLARSGGQNEC